jgi:hypothetical protein
VENAVATRDQLHQHARRALENDGWTITHDPLVVPFGTTYNEIDLGAQQVIGAEKEHRRIAVEIKSFLGKSLLSEFYVALGQYLSYQEALRSFDADRVLFLAIPEDAWQSFFSQDIVRRIIENYSLRILVFEVQNQRVTLWTS